jgi:cephalosporin hydroxylase
VSDTDIPYDLLMAIQRGTLAYTYRGVPMLKNPFDLALYPLLLDRAKPRTLIEIGTNAGGSAMWFADHGVRVVSVDLNPPALDYPKVTFVRGDARALDLDVATFERPLMVVEDADHRAGTTAAVLDYFDRWLEPGEWIVIEDGILSDMRVAELYDGGPLRAIREFVARTNGRYEIDRGFCDYFGRNVTWNVDGWLRRVR